MCITTTDFTLHHIHFQLKFTFLFVISNTNHSKCMQKFQTSYYTHIPCFTDVIHSTRTVHHQNPWQCKCKCTDQCAHLTNFTDQSSVTVKSEFPYSKGWVYVISTGVNHTTSFYNFSH
jgi:hypothetical protein